jgi:ribosomal protein S18 acetylase RimI-like enzyme
VSDLRELQRIVQDAWRLRGPPVDFHVGDLAWASREPGYEIRLWPGAGAVRFPPAELELVLADAPDDVISEALDWFEPEEIWALENDAPRLAELERRGYCRDEGPFFLHMTRALDDLPQPELPEGYAIRPIGDDLERRVAVQRAAFAGSTLTTEKYARLIRTWPYDPELDLAVEAPDGSFASFCTAWLDDENRVGELEPVGTDPTHGRRGLARAVCLAALGALREHGAEQAVVLARGDDAYPAPRALYGSLGFEPIGLKHRYTRR